MARVQALLSHRAAAASLQLHSAASQSSTELVVHTTCGKALVQLSSSCPDAVCATALFEMIIAHIRPYCTLKLGSADAHQLGKAAIPVRPASKYRIGHSYTSKGCAHVPIVLIVHFSQAPTASRISRCYTYAMSVPLKGIRGPW